MSHERRSSDENSERSSRARGEIRDLVLPGKMVHSKGVQLCGQTHVPESSVAGEVAVSKPTVIYQDGGRPVDVFTDMEAGGSSRSSEEGDGGRGSSDGHQSSLGEQVATSGLGETRQRGTRFYDRVSSASQVISTKGLTLVSAFCAYTIVFGMPPLGWMAKLMLVQLDWFLTAMLIWLHIGVGYARWWWIHGGADLYGYLRTLAVFAYGEIASWAWDHRKVLLRTLVFSMLTGFCSSFLWWCYCRWLFMQEWLYVAWASRPSWWAFWRWYSWSQLPLESFLEVSKTDSQRPTPVVVEPPTIVQEVETSSNVRYWLDKGSHPTGVLTLHAYVRDEHKAMRRDLGKVTVTKHAGKVVWAFTVHQLREVIPDPGSYFLTGDGDVTIPFRWQRILCYFKRRDLVFVEPFPADNSVLRVRAIAMAKGKTAVSFARVFNYDVGEGKWYYTLGRSRMADFAQIHHSCSTIPGCSGSPLLIQESGTWRAVGVHTGGFTTPPKDGFANLATSFCFLNTRNWEQVHNLLSNPPPEAPDMSKGKQEESSKEWMEIMAKISDRQLRMELEEDFALDDSDSDYFIPRQDYDDDRELYEDRDHAQRSDAYEGRSEDEDDEDNLRREQHHRTKVSAWAYLTEARCPLPKRPVRKPDPAQMTPLTEEDLARRREQEFWNKPGFGCEREVDGHYATETECLACKTRIWRPANYQKVRKLPDAEIAAVEAEEREWFESFSTESGSVPEQPPLKAVAPVGITGEKKADCEQLQIPQATPSEGRQSANKVVKVKSEKLGKPKTTPTERKQETKAKANGSATQKASNARNRKKKGKKAASVPTAGSSEKSASSGGQPAAQ
jgi:hypothetical protein